MLNVGENFLHYRIISAIGSGGMGEVYLAKDNQLERKVAIKVLRKKFGKNEDGLRRFIREARSASALNHPNIITIYEIGESEGANYIASEYIEGKTLHTRIANRSLSFTEILEISIQAAEAISAAHAAGIIHRDIKPENLMIRNDGYVKVLDFGLAKLTEQDFFSADFDAVTHKLVQTSPGVVMGTVSYMSPEQTRGREIDTRSDIWSLGVVMYEMIAGVLPFRGETTSDMIAAILTSTPKKLTEIVPEIPAELEQVVERALQKERDDRYVDVKELLSDLKSIRRHIDAHSFEGENGHRPTEFFRRPQTTGDRKAESDGTRSVTAAGTASISQIFLESFRRHPMGMTAGVGGLILFTAVVIVALIAFVRSPGVDAFSSLRFSKLTSLGNAEGGQIAISPDGKYVAYALRDGANQSLWVKNVASAGNAQIISPSPARFRGLTFDPDGGFIFYVVAHPDGSSSIERISVLGGEAKKIATSADGPVTFAPKGDRFAFVRNDRILMAVNADGNEASEMARAGDGEIWWLPVWSPDGKTIAGTVYSNETSRVGLFALDVDSKQIQKFGNQNWLRVSGLAWEKDGKALRLSGRDPETQLSQLWSVKYPTGTLERITNDLGSYQGLSVTFDGGTAVSVQEYRASNIWTADLADIRNPKKITSELSQDDGMSGVAFRPDGGIVYSKRVTGSQDIWSVDPNGENNRQLTVRSGSNFHPTVSPDGKTIVFTSDRAGSLDLWRMNMDGSSVARLTEVDENESQPSFTADGAWIVFQRSGNDGRSSIWKIPASGGEPVQLLPAGASRPRISPDGKLLACEFSATPNGATKIGIYSVDDGKEIALYDFSTIVASSIFRWSNDGKSLVYVHRLDGGFEIWSQLLSGGQPSRLAASNGDRIYDFDISRNGKAVVFSRGTENSDVILVNGMR